MPVRVKICGVTNAADLEAAVGAGADAIGLVLADSPRKLSLSAAKDLARRTPPYVSVVAVMRHPQVAQVDEMLQTFVPDMVQTELSQELYEHFPAVRWIPVCHEGPTIEEEVNWATSHGLSVHLEAAGRGGRGVAPDWTRATEIARTSRLILAGGLTPENVLAAVATVQPYGVDVSSGVERAPGHKDPARIRAFVTNAKGQGKREHRKDCSENDSRN